MLSHSATLPDWPHLHCLLRRKKHNVSALLQNTKRSYVQFSIWGCTGLSGRMLEGSTVWGESLAVCPPLWWSPGQVCDHLGKGEEGKHLDVESEKPDKWWRLTHGRLIWQCYPKREGAKTGYFRWVCSSDPSFGLQPKPPPDSAKTTSNIGVLECVTSHQSTIFFTVYLDFPKRWPIENLLSQFMSVFSEFKRSVIYWEHTKHCGSKCKIKQHLSKWGWFWRRERCVKPLPAPPPGSRPCVSFLSAWALQDGGGKPLQQQRPKGRQGCRDWPTRPCLPDFKVEKGPESLTSNTELAIELIC